MFKLNPIILSCFLLFVLVFSSCKTQNLFESGNAGTYNTVKHTKSDLNAFTIVKADYQYRIRKDDKINISVWDHEDISVGSLYGIYNSNEVYGKWLMVNANGEINVPKVGLLKVKGLTIIESQEILKKLYAEWVKNPIVEVKVLNKEITVLGELKSPGKFLVEKDDNTLVEMLARAGDFDFYANRKKVKVIRMENGEAKEITIDLTRSDNYMAANIQVIPGDVIYVPSKKGKDFEKRVSTILPFASVITAFAIVFKTFF